jgi:hypothetical protein
MKTIVDCLQKKNMIFKSLKEISPKTLNSRKHVKIYLGVDLKTYYTAVMYLEKKSRVIQKEAQTLIFLHEKLESHLGSKITKKNIFIKAPLCSKAKAFLEACGWKVWQENV